MNQIKPVELPKDNGPHNFMIEWWYFNGHVTDKKGKEYSFMDCFFKINISKVPVPLVGSQFLQDIFQDGEYIHFAHSVLSDIFKKKSYKEVQHLSFITADTFKKDLLYINYKDAYRVGKQINGEIIEIAPNDFHIKNKNLDLVLESKKKPLLEGGHGYVGTSENGSYYYSFTDLSVVGSINIKGEDIEVKGKAWMDHQWANMGYNNGKKEKWNWFSFQMENGTDIMCVEYDKEDGTDTLIDMIDKDGHQTQYKKAIFKPGKDCFKSKETKSKFPLSWQIEIPEADIIIKTSAILKSEEMIFGQLNYWEGPLKATLTSSSSSSSSKPIHGKGFMELVGYPSNYNYLLLKEKEIQKSLFGKVKNFLKIKSTRL